MSRKKHRPAPRARVIDRAFLDRYLVNFRNYQDAIAAEGYSAPLYGQMGSFLAAWEAVLFDGPVEPSAACEVVAALKLAGIIDAASHTQGPEDCLARLMSYPVKVRCGGGGVEVMALGELVGLAYRNKSNDYVRTLRRYGLVWKVEDADNQFLCVAERGTELEKIFFGTRWAGRSWSESLRRLDRAHTSRKTVWLASEVQRPTWLEASLILKPSVMEAAKLQRQKKKEAEARRKQGANRAEEMSDDQ